MPRLSWPRATKIAMIQAATHHGHVEAHLDTPREAELFRMALYRFIQRNGYNPRALTIGVKGATVTLSKPNETRIILSTGDNE